MLLQLAEIVSLLPLSSHDRHDATSELISLDLLHVIASYKL